MRRPATLALALLLLAAPRRAPAQERGAAALGELLEGLDVTARVLVVGAHPDDEDTQLIAWLARGRHVETAYLSLTRGDGGQNLIGDELGEALGVIRTEELLAARRVDGGRQYFTRAYDFGFSKSAEEAFTHWPKDSLLGDVVTVIRSFRPHVVVSVFSGTPRDGHGQHQAAGILAREGYDVAGDSARFPAAATAGLGAWTPLKFYRSSRFAPDQATLSFNVGEYSPLLGRSYAEIAGESRSQHKSQGFGALQRKGAILDHVRREHTRAPAPPDATQERSLLDGVPTAGLPDATMVVVREAQRAPYFRDPTSVVAPLGRLATALDERDVVLADVRRRADRALALATGVVAEAMAERELIAAGDSVRVTFTIYNRGPAAITARPQAFPACLGRVASDSPRARTRGGWEDAVAILPDSARSWTFHACGGPGVSQPWWLATPRRGDLFAEASTRRPEGEVGATPSLLAEVEARTAAGGATFVIGAPIVHRVADPVRGDVTRPLAAAPAVSLALDRAVEYAPANTPIDRPLRVELRSAATAERSARVTLSLPRGLTADSAARTVTLPGYGAVRTATFRLRGRLPAGRHVIEAVAESGGQRFTSGYQLVDYEHVRPQRLYRQAAVAIQAVDVRLPAPLAVAYVRGVSDNVAPALEQLGLRVTLLDPAALPATDLSRFGAVVVGPRAYEASEALVEHNARLLDYARGGGTLVVQYGQYEMTRPGMMPFPVTINRPHDRVTDERAPVRLLDPASPLLTTPNRITDADFAGWVQERSLYMPRTFDPTYRTVLATADPGETANPGAILVAPYGRGTYVYTTLAFFRQLPAGVPGAARLFVNLLAAGRAAAPRAAAGTP
jgi:LmbE family N-acetylglucosaminyl deacetylase